MMKNILYILSVFTILSCSSQKDFSQYDLSGTINNAPEDGSLILEHLSASKITALDTFQIDASGQFGFNIESDEVGFYRLRKDERSFITLIVNPGEKIVVKTDWNLGMTPYEVEGSEESIRLIEINQMMSTFYRKRDSLSNVFKMNEGDQNVLLQLQNEYAAMMTTNQEKVLAFITKYPGSLACLAAAEQLNPDQDFEYYQKIDQGLAENYGNTPYYSDFHKMVERLSRLAVGSEAPEILLPNKNGEVVPLSSLKGKVVLVDFWASWCKPCRMENPNVVAAYEKYKDKGFEVYGVSLDKNKEDWIRAINQDQLFWTQVSDLKFWQSSVVRLYDIQGIPFALLLDKDGKIIAKNLRGQDLHNKLEEILNS